MNGLNSIALILAIVLIAFIYFDLSRKGVFTGKDNNTTVIIKDSTILPPITVNVPPGKPTIIYQPVPADVDTSEVIRAFFAQLNYSDSVITDTVSIYIRESVTRNMLSAREVKWKLNIPIQTVTEYHTSKRELMIGAMAGYTDRVNLSLMGGYKTQNGQLFMAGYDFASHGVSVGYLRRVW